MQFELLQNDGIQTKLRISYSVSKHKLLSCSHMSVQANIESTVMYKYR